MDKIPQHTQLALYLVGPVLYSASRDLDLLFDSMWKFALAPGFDRWLKNKRGCCDPTHWEFMCRWATIHIRAAMELDSWTATTGDKGMFLLRAEYFVKAAVALIQNTTEMAMKTENINVLTHMSNWLSPYIREIENVRDRVSAVYMSLGDSHSAGLFCGLISEFDKSYIVFSGKKGQLEKQRNHKMNVALTSLIGGGMG